MAICRRCKSNRMVSVSAKCGDCCSVTYKNEDYQGYVPDDLGIGGRDMVEFTYCLRCGQIQGKFPLEDPECFEGDDDPEDLDDLDAGEDDEEDEE